MWNRKKCMRTRIHSGALSVFLLTVLALQPYYIYAENDKTDEADPIELYVSPEGSDEGQGTIDEPLATVSAVRDMPVSYTHLDVYKRQHISNEN